MAWCRQMLSLSPMALRMMKGGLHAADDGLAGLQQFAGDATMLFYMSEEGQEGRNAFQEHRPPDFAASPAARDGTDRDRRSRPQRPGDASRGRSSVGCWAPGPARCPPPWSRCWSARRLAHLRIRRSRRCRPPGRHLQSAPPRLASGGGPLGALVVALAIQIGTNYANDYSDGIRGTDDVRVGPVRLVASGLAPPARSSGRRSPRSGWPAWSVWGLPGPRRGGCWRWARPAWLQGGSTPAAPVRTDTPARRGLRLRLLRRGGHGRIGFRADRAPGPASVGGVGARRLAGHRVVVGQQSPGHRLRPAVGQADPGRTDRSAVGRTPVRRLPGAFRLRRRSREWRPPGARGPCLPWPRCHWPTGPCRWC